MAPMALLEHGYHSLPLQSLFHAPGLQLSLLSAYSAEALYPSPQRGGVHLYEQLWGPEQEARHEQGALPQRPRKARISVSRSLPRGESGPRVPHPEAEGHCSGDPGEADPSAYTCSLLSIRTHLPLGCLACIMPSRPATKTDTPPMGGQWPLPGPTSSSGASVALRASGAQPGPHTPPYAHLLSVRSSRGPKISQPVGPVGWRDSVHIPNLNLGRSPLSSPLQNMGEASAWKQLSPKGGGGTCGSPASTTMQSHTSARVT